MLYKKTIKYFILILHAFLLFAGVSHASDPRGIKYIYSNHFYKKEAKNNILCRALRLQKWEKVTEIIEKGIKLDHTCADGSPISHMALRFGNTELFLYFLLKGSDPKAVDDKNITALHWAVLDDNSEKIIDYLIGVGLDPNATSKNQKWTPLHWASSAGKIKNMEILLDAGASIEAKDSFEFTPLYSAAVQPNNAETVKFLLSKGADVSAKDITGGNLLHVGTASDSHEEINKILIESGVDVNEKNVLGKTPLHLLAEYSYYYNVLESFKLLIKNGADVLLKDKKNRTILHSASISGDIKLENKTPNPAVLEEIMTILIKNGVEIYEKDDDGNTAIDLAENKDVRKILIRMETLRI